MKTLTRTGLILSAIMFLYVNSGLAQPPGIDTVSPASAAPDETKTVTITLSGHFPPDIGTATIGGTAGTIQNYSDTTGEITAEFNFQGESAGNKDVVVTFTTPDGTETLTKANGFLIGSTGSLTVTINSEGTAPTGAMWNVDSGSWNESGAKVTGLAEGTYTVSFSQVAGWDKPDDMTVSISGDVTKTATYTENSVTLTYPIVDTGQDSCSGDSAEITCPASGEAFYGQDAQHAGYQISYESKTISGGKVVNDLVTGLMWQQTIDTDGDGDIDASDKKTLSDSRTYCENLTLAGYTDWRLPNIKELYSLMDLRGGDCSGYEESDTSILTPFIDNTVFGYNWGDTASGERIIDSQYASDTEYVDTTANNGGTMFGVNFADGRIKGYGVTTHDGYKTFYCQCVRGNTNYGVNNFTDNGDDTITDNASGLMWAKYDNGSGLNWEEALAWVATKNSGNYLGYSDWRMPNAKELQSILDYTRSPSTTTSAAIDPMFNATKITNEANQDDYPYYWTSTTHLKYTGSVDFGVYISFGRALGYFGLGDGWEDVHGAGAQRSDPKSGDPNDYPEGHGPQGDAVRIYNYVRLVRDAETVSIETGSLTVTLSPQDAIDAGAQWQADGGSWQSSGATVSSLSTGTHTVSFKTVSGWTAPSDQSVSISANQTKTVTGTYTEIVQQTGSLKVTLSPQDAIDAGAQWQTDGGSWQSSGATVSSLSAGTHTVSFKTVDGWTAPSDQSVSITANQTKTVTGTYTETVQQTGSLKVTLSPQDAIDAGAQWQADGGSWQNSGTTVSSLSAGTHTVSFKTIDGWTAPSDQSVSISANQTKTVTGTYTETVQQTGSLKVTLSPQDAIDAGAQWQADGGSWQNSGATVSSLSAGTHTVSFKTIDGWTAPSDQAVSINGGVTKAINGTYTIKETYTLADAIVILQMFCGVTSHVSEGYKDANGDGKAGLEDVIYILQFVSEIR